MTMSDIYFHLADWALINSEVVTTAAAAAAVFAISEIHRTPAEQTLWLAIQNSVINLAENGPRPNSPYLSIHMELVKRTGLLPARGTPVLVDPLHPEKGVNVPVTYLEEVHLYMQGYGADMNNKLQLLQQSLMRDHVIEDLRNVGIIFQSDSGIQDIHIPIDISYEDRWAYDVVFHVSQTIQDNVMHIESVPITPTILPPV